MTEEPKPESDSAETAEFERVLKNLANTPPKPHPKPEPGRKRGRPSGGAPTRGA